MIARRPFLHRIGAMTLAGGLALAVASCGGGIGGTGAPQTGTLRVALTDAPACGYDQVNVSIREVRVHASAGAADDDAGWRTVVSFPASAPKRVDLLTLTNGVIEELGAAELPAGTYTQLRLVLADNGGATPFANSVVPTGGAETALQTPSGQQSGLKLNVNIAVPEGRVADVVLDFDACKSVVQAGRSGRFLLKPVIAVLPRLSDAGTRVVGYVDPALAVAGTVVSVQQAGRVIRSTPPVTSGSEAGRFQLYPLPEGSFDLVVAAPGRATAVITGVPVQVSAPTIVSTSTARISPPTSTVRTVTGNVSLTPPVTDNLSTVRALQSLSGGLTVEVASRPVDASDGSFALSLPLAAPVRAAFVASPTAIALAADGPVGGPPAGRYTLEAAAPGATAPKSTAIDLAAPALPPVNFSFP